MWKRAQRSVRSVHIARRTCAAKAPLWAPIDRNGSTNARNHRGHNRHFSPIRNHSCVLFWALVVLETSMFDAVFSFRGRINRLQYFLSVLALTTVTVFLLVVLAVSYLKSGAPQNLVASLGPMILLLLVTAPAFLWISFALQARRFRDIGWSPVIVIPAWITADVFDLLMAKAVPSLAIGKLHQQTPFGLLVGLVLTCALLFWPGKADEGASPASNDPWPRSEDSTRAQASPPMRDAAIRSVAPASGGFGRRGL
jgi:uncharacterized membrane protein YhaH (DUF805 family)